MKIYITIILSVVLHGWGTWSVALKGQRRLRVFEKSLQIWACEGRGNGDSSKLHSEELHNLYFSPNSMRGNMTQR
jgi:hypothetical protein